MSAADCCTTLLTTGGGEGHTTNHASQGHDLSQDNTDGDSIMLLEPRPFRPFKTSEEYLYAMREDLAEWLHNLYNLDINVDNFFEVLETGEVLCGHANNVRRLAEELRQQQQTDPLQSLPDVGSTPGRKYSSKWEIPPYDVHYRSDVIQGSFFARDNIHNFITWCRDLGIHEVLLFETDDLVLRKNEKHVILSLLEVARRGARFGMAAPLLVQMEADIDRELEQERLAEERMAESGGQFNEDEAWANGGHDLTPPEPPKVFYGPQAQIITNDLKSLDEMVRDLVERCSCPSQFPMVKVSEGKYRIGDTKVLIFVRILRNHVMVRVGGGWDTLEHYLDKHDPCRCRQGHRVALASRVGFKTSNSGQERQLMNVTYDSKKSANGHTLSIQTTTVRLTQQEALREGRRMIEEGLKSRKESLDSSNLTKMPLKTEFTIEVKPLSEKRSSLIGASDKFLSHSEVEKQVLTSLAKIESEALAVNSDNTLTMKHRRKSSSTRDLVKTVPQKSSVKSAMLSEDIKLDFHEVMCPIQKSPKKLIKAKSSLTLSSSVASSPVDKTSSKKDAVSSESSSLSKGRTESSKQVALSKQKYTEQPQHPKTSSSSALKYDLDRHLKSSDLSSIQGTSAACKLGKPKISVHVHQASPSTAGVLNHKLKTKTVLHSQIQKSDKSVPAKVSQKTKSEMSLDVSLSKEHDQGNKIISPESKRLAQLSSPKKVSLNAANKQESSQGKTSQFGSNFKRKPLSNTEEGCQPYQSRKDELSLHQNDKPSSRSKIPVSTNAVSPIKQPSNHDNRAHHRGKDLLEKHSSPEKSYQNLSSKHMSKIKNETNRTKLDNCFCEEGQLNNIISSKRDLDSRAGGSRRYVD